LGKIVGFMAKSTSRTGSSSAAAAAAMPTTTATIATAAGAAAKVVQSVQTCPSFRAGHLPTVSDVERLRSLTAPHVESFNYFLEHGLNAGLQCIEAAELDLIDAKSLPSSALADATTIQFWVEHASIAKPTKASSSMGRVNTTGYATGSSAAAAAASTRKLLPREARERGLMYSGTLTATFAYRFLERRNNVLIPNKVHKLVKTFGEMPVMVLSNACHLKDSTPRQLSQLKEEVSGRRGNEGCHVDDLRLGSRALTLLLLVLLL
jgi:DNA-directed RNA polymerase beta subunit